MIVHSTVLDVALRAAQLYGLPDDRIVLLDKPSHKAVSDIRQSASAAFTHRTINVPDLITRGLGQPSAFTDLALKPGEGKTKVALLSWSSGTTGTPKVGIGHMMTVFCARVDSADFLIRYQAVAISHYALIANVIQMAVHCGVRKTCNTPASLFRPGDTTLGG
jgi:hypothetical protein